MCAVQAERALLLRCGALCKRFDAQYVERLEGRQGLVEVLALHGWMMQHAACHKQSGTRQGCGKARFLAAASQYAKPFLFISVLTRVKTQCFHTFVLSRFVARFYETVH